ncbi:MAG: TadE/TadG family type IV pilus assembly protein [Pseudomonadota bacterium]
MRSQQVNPKRDTGRNDGQRRFACGFGRDERGAVLIISAFLLPILLMVVGFGVDYSNAVRVRTTIATALDAALLAAARDLSIGAIDESDVNAQVNAYFDANVAGSNLNNISVGEVETSLDTNDGTISGSVNADVQTAFSGIVQTDNINVGTDAEATYNLLNVELALVLDVTGSMGGSRLSNMKTAANDLIDLIIPETNQSGGIDKVRVSVVPYSDLVNVGTYEQLITGYSSGESCVYERAGVYARRQTPPVGPVDGFGPEDDDGEVNDPPSGNGNRDEKTIVNDERNFRGYVCNNPTLLPLSGDKETLKAQINSLSASGWTSGHIGIQWGWYTLSPRFNRVWPTESDARDYNEPKNLKVMVVMTDGSFNTWYEDDIGNSYDQAELLCRNIKRRDILLYTVAFQAPNDAETFLRGCASGPEYYFETSTGSSLRSAFEQIAQRLRALRLSS